MTRLTVRPFLLIAVLAAALASGGCAAQRAVEAGDAARAQGHYVEAMVQYDSAIGHAPHLLKQKQFAAVYHETQWRAAHERGQRLAASGAFEAAIEQFDRTLQLNPGYQPAIAARQAAHRSAAADYHHRAVQAADAGDLTAARNAIETALRFDPNNAEALAASQSLQAPSPPALVADLRAEKRWRKTADALEDAIEVDANDLPARAALHEAEDHLAEADNHRRRAQQLLKDFRLDRAIAELRQSLSIWPHDAVAADLLTRAESQRHEAEALYHAGVDHAAQKNWDMAIVSLSRSQTLFPHHEAAKKLLEQTRRDAAADLTARGDELLREKQFDDAEAAYRRALGYRADHEPAKAGLAGAAFERGQAAEQAGKLGESLLRYRDAAAQQPKAPYASHVKRIEKTLTERYGYRIAIDVYNARGDATADTVALDHEITKRLSSTAPSQVSVLESSDSQADDEAPTYRAEITVSLLDIRPKLVRSESRTHSYSNYVNVPNPEIGYLRHRLYAAEHHLDRLQRKQRHGHVSHLEISQAEWEARDLRRDLAYAPAYVRHAIPASWTYRVEHHEIRGQLKLNVTIPDRSTDKTAQQFKVETTAADQDATVINPNADLGVREDPLQLPSTEQMFSKIVADAARKTAANLLATTSRLRAQELQAAGYALMMQDPDEGMNQEAAAAVMLRSADEGESKRLLEKLHQRLR